MSEQSISFEGGPILVGAVESLAVWRGVESDDYEALCAAFDSAPEMKVIAVPASGGRSVAIDFGGPGTVRIFQSDKGLVLIRAWPVDPDSERIYSDALEAARQSDYLNGLIEFPSDTIGIAWGAESLSGIPDEVSEPMCPKIDLAIDGSVVLHPFRRGRYRWSRTEKILPSGSVIIFALDPA